MPRGQEWHEHVPLPHSGGRKREESVPRGRKENQAEGSWGEGRLGRLIL